MKALLHLGGLMATASATQAVAERTGWGGHEVAEVIRSLATLLGALGGVLWVVYAMQSARSKKGPIIKPPKGPGGAALVLLLGFMVMMGGLAGCAASAERRLEIARGTYTAALNAASDLREAGKVSDDAYKQIEAGRASAALALAMLDVDAASGVKPDEATLVRLERAISELVGAVRRLYGSGGNSGGVGVRGGVVGGVEQGRASSDGGGGGGGETETGGGGGPVGGSGSEGVNVDTSYFGDNLKLPMSSGDAGVYETLWVMRACVDDAVESGGPTAQLGTRIAASAGRGEVPQVKSIYQWVRENVTFKRDPIGLENVRHPDQLVCEVEEYGRTSADCDDVAMLVASLLRHCGIRPALAVVSVKPDGVFHHVTAGAYLRAKLVVVDPQEKMWRFPSNAVRVAVLSW